MGERFYFYLPAYAYQLATAYAASRRERVACVTHGSMSACVSSKIPDLQAALGSYKCILVQAERWSVSYVLKLALLFPW
jgi:hypothetical protein